MSDKPKAGSFSPYLEALQKRERSAKQASGTSPIHLLTVLVDTESHELPVSDLMSKSGMEFTDYADALKRLSSAGYVDMIKAAGGEVVHLTDKGAEIANLSQGAS